MKKRFYLGLLLFFTVFTFANPRQEPLPVAQAFAPSATVFGNDTVIVSWNIAPEHYLYRDRFHFKVLQPAQAMIGHIIAPPGQAKHDPLSGDYAVYTDHAALTVPLLNPDNHNTLLQVSYQGCSEQGYCYPPTLHQFQVNFANGTVSDVAVASPTPPVSVVKPSQQQHFINLLTDHHLTTAVLIFFGFGVLLSLTPCVLPMIPILSGIIIGHQKTVLHGKAFRLSFVYVMSMAITYAIAGMLVGWIGGSVQTLFQQAWLIILSSVIFVLLALAFFGIYSLKLPAKFEERISLIINHQRKGHYAGVAMMGCLATLIISPCVSPALVGVLGYISQTGNAVFGGVSLFALGFGMGLPLLVVGLAGSRFLPKAGHWMQTLEYFFGVVFLGMAIWMLSRIIPAPITLLLWGMLAMVSAVYLGALSSSAAIRHGWDKLWQGIGLVLLAYGILLLVGAAKGNSNPLQPLVVDGHSTTPINRFTPVRTLAELQAILARTPLEKPILIDFYADWCISCKSMERNVYTDANVQQALSHFTVLKADVTANNAADKELMSAFNVIAPPSFLVFDTQGQLRKSLTHTGEMNVAEFINYLQQYSDSR